MRSLSSRTTLCKEEKSELIRRTDGSNYKLPTRKTSSYRTKSAKSKWFELTKSGTAPASTTSCTCPTDAKQGN
uniref:Uncharacterized protein n=1 Tax=Globodera rostochiensis TaxID=31243 RepID=A0A914HHZ7_GLORO